MPRPRTVRIELLEDALRAAFSKRDLIFVSMSRKTQLKITIVYQYAPAAYRSLDVETFQAHRPFDAERNDDELYDEALVLIDRVIKNGHKAKI